MDKKFGLSKTEYELMEFFWDNPGEKSFKEILGYFKNIKRKNRKKNKRIKIIKKGNIKNKILKK